jgi:hypothetical protein
LGDFFPPDRNRPFHDFRARGEKEFFDEIARPFPALVTGVIPFGSHAAPDLTGFTETVDFFGRVRLHAAQAFGFFCFSPVQIAHHRFEFLIAVTSGYVNPTGPAIKPARGHQIPVSEFFLGPSFHAAPPGLGIADRIAMSKLSKDENPS